MRRKARASGPLEGSVAAGGGVHGGGAARGGRKGGGRRGGGGPRGGPPACPQGGHAAAPVEQVEVLVRGVGHGRLRDATRRPPSPATAARPAGLGCGYGAGR